MAALSPLEQKVLYGLVKVPGVSDRVLADWLDVKRSTFTHHKNELLSGGVYRKVWVPDFARLGCELLVARHTRYSVLTNYQDRKDLALGEGVFSHVATDREDITFTAAKDYTDAAGQFYAYEQRVAERELADRGDIDYAFFPVAHTQLYRFHEYGDLLAEHFGIAAKKPPALPEPFLGGPQVTLTPSESRILSALVSYPDAPIEDIAGQANASRHVVSRAKSRLLRQGLLHLIRIPDPEAVGLSTLVYTRTQHSGRYPLEKRRKGADVAIEGERFRFFVAAGRFETVSLALYPDYDTFRRRWHSILKRYHEEGYFLTEPFVEAIPCADVARYETLDFSSLLSHLMALS